MLKRKEPNNKNKALNEENKVSNFKKWFDNDNYSNGLRVVSICLLAVLLVVGVNLLGNILPTKATKIDVTTERVFSISRDTTEEMANLDKQVDVYFVCEDGSENLNTEIMLNLYADASDKISVKKVDPVLDPSILLSYTGETELNNNSLIVVSGNRRQIIKYSDYYNSGTFVLEDYLNSAINYVTSDMFNIVYNLVGHDEQKLDKDVKSYLGLDGFEIEDLDLATSAKIPDDCSLLLINYPQKDLTSNEASIILSYLKKGGKLFLNTGYTSNYSNIETIVSYFGAHQSSGYVMETDENRYYEGQQTYVLPTIYTNIGVLTDGINYVLFPNCKSILLDEQIDKSVEVTTIFEASESSFSVETNIFTGETKTTQGPHILAAAFSKGNDGSEGELVWATTGYLSSSEISDIIGGGNITFFLNTICYLGKDNTVPSIHGKTISTKFLKIDDTANKIWMVVIPGIIPGAVILLGAIVYIRRKRR